MVSIELLCYIFNLISMYLFDPQSARPCSTTSLGSRPFRRGPFLSLLTKFAITTSPDKRVEILTDPPPHTTKWRALLQPSSSLAGSIKMIPACICQCRCWAK